MNRSITIDPDRCIGCGTCLAACSESHAKVGLQVHPRLSLVSTRDISAAVTCHHCEGAPCMKVCPVDAITREGDFIHVNEQTCIGCRLCATACPFGAICPSGTPISGVAGVSFPTPTFPADTSCLLRWEIGVQTRAVKCDMCYYEQEGPRCVAACPTHALSLLSGDSLSHATVDKRRSAAASGEFAHPAGRGVGER